MVFMLVDKRHMHVYCGKSHKRNAVLRSVIKLKLAGVWKLRGIRKKLLIHWTKKLFLVTQVKIGKPKAIFGLN